MFTLIVGGGEGGDDRGEGRLVREGGRERPTFDGKTKDDEGTKRVGDNKESTRTGEDGGDLSRRSGLFGRLKRRERVTRRPSFGKGRERGGTRETIVGHVYP